MKFFLDLTNVFGPICKSTNVWTNRYLISTWMCHTGGTNIDVVFEVASFKITQMDIAPLMIETSLDLAWPKGGRPLPINFMLLYNTCRKKT